MAGEGARGARAAGQAPVAFAERRRVVRSRPLRGRGADEAGGLRGALAAGGAPRRICGQACARARERMRQV